MPGYLQPPGTAHTVIFPDTWPWFALQYMNSVCCVIKIISSLLGCFWIINHNITYKGFLFSDYSITDVFSFCFIGSFKEMEQGIFLNQSSSGARRSTAPLLSPRYLGKIDMDIQVVLLLILSTIPLVVTVPNPSPQVDPRWCNRNPSSALESFRPPKPQPFY